MIIGAGLSLVGTIIGASATARAAAKQEKIAKTRINNETNLARLKGQKDKANAYRVYLASRGETLSNTTNSGAGGSTAALGALSQGMGTAAGQQNTSMATAQIADNIGAADKRSAEVQAELDRKRALATGIQGVGGFFTAASGPLGRMTA